MYGEQSYCPHTNTRKAGVQGRAFDEAAAINMSERQLRQRERDREPRARARPHGQTNTQRHARVVCEWEASTRSSLWVLAFSQEIEVSGMACERSPSRTLGVAVTTVSLSRAPTLVTRSVKGTSFFVASSACAPARQHEAGPHAHALIE